jgi:hypothetical protein
VYARNALATYGPPTAEFSVVAADVADAPTGVTTTYNAPNIDISWVAPVSDGGDSISGYDVYF